MGRSMNMIVIAGAILVLVGIAGLAMPVFDTTQNKEVAHIGDLHVDAKESTTHFIPPLVSGGALVLGMILIGGGLMRRA
jgi:hypothetical protein